MAELLPCPFCGGKAFVSARLPYFGEPATVAVVCEDCNASSKHKIKEEDAIKAWNTRTNVGGEEGESVKIKSTESLYNDFRIEIEKICTPEILKQLTTIKLIKDDIDVGILSFIRQNEWIYIDALYVVPEYRKNGIGRNAVLNWYDEYKDEEIRLHIVHKNDVAQNFWKSIFELEEIESNFLDSLYRIKKLKSQ